MATLVPALIQLSDPRVAAQLVRTMIAIVKYAFAKRKLLLTRGSDRSKKIIMKISGVECAIVWWENTELYIFIRLYLFGM